MKRRSMLLLVLCVFLAGVFIGILVEWSVWKKTASKRVIAYELENYQVANLRVHAGDTIQLVMPGGGPATGIKMKFVGNIPCENQIKPDTCVISDKALTGGYFFNCDSGNGNVCPDPGIQPTPKQPLEGPVQTIKARPAGSVVTAIVSCDDKNNTALNLRNGDSAKQMPVKLGQSVFWISPPKFTLSGLPPGLCLLSAPTGGDGDNPAECDLDPHYNGPNPAKYQVQQDQCGATAAELDIQ